KSIKRIGNWLWWNNPFLSTRELNGLRVMMALINNWDLVSRNNSIYELDGQRRYVVSDLGSSFGRSGTRFTRSKGVMEEYVRSRFIARMTPDTVDFVMPHRSIPFFILPLPIQTDLTRGQQIARDIPRADARWMGERLARLSEAQIRDCFRAGGFA